ncbi:ABC-type sugar transport system, periplasmic component [Raoultella planticola]|uniref:ABC-type sugar transport system, periplasmic component n=1 Tax=Raoultella planticola TaxID=575 RepID=A0A485AU08_RAOPL|nr:ABC-type sugar transport system, periplasmic component [Raoultella planticola]
MHTPERFSELVREALSSQLASFNPFRIQLRFHCYEDISEREMNALLKKCALSSHGVILKAMNSPSLVSTIDALLKRRVPVVTIVTDIPSSARLRYIGMDNVDAGKAAAFLMSKWLGADSTQIAAVTGSNDFIGERERIAGFISGIEQFAPRNSINVVAGGLGIDHQMYACLCQYLDAHPHTEAVYTVGGGNAGIIRAFAERNRRIKTFIGHDFDRENRALMQAGKIDALIEHNLQLDAQTAFRSLLAFHGFIPEGDSLKPLFTDQHHHPVQYVYLKGRCAVGEECASTSPQRYAGVTHSDPCSWLSTTASTNATPLRPSYTCGTAAPVRLSACCASRLCKAAAKPL